MVYKLFNKKLHRGLRATDFGNTMDIHNLWEGTFRSSHHTLATLINRYRSGPLASSRMGRPSRPDEPDGKKTRIVAAIKLTMADIGTRLQCGHHLGCNVERHLPCNITPLTAQLKFLKRWTTGPHFIKCSFATRRYLIGITRRAFCYDVSDWKPGRRFYH